MSDHQTVRTSHEAVRIAQTAKMDPDMKSLRYARRAAGCRTRPPRALAKCMAEFRDSAATSRIARTRLARPAGFESAGEAPAAMSAKKGRPNR